MKPYYLQPNFQRKQGAVDGESQSDAFLDRCFRRESYRAWLDEQRQLAAEADGAADYSALCDRLNPVLDFLGASVESRNLGIRTWCFLKMVRPHLVGHETFESAANRFGLSRQVLCRLFDELRLSIPGLIAGTREIEARTTQERRRTTLRAQYLRKLNADFDSDPHAKPEPIGPRDSRGLLFDPEKFRTCPDGAPRLDSLGRYIPLRLGRSKAA